MVIKGAIGFSFFLLLMAVGMNGYCYEYTPFATLEESQTAITSPHKTDVPVVSVTATIKRHVVVKDKIKVRYMGGECKYEGTVSFTCHTRHDHLTDKISSHYISYTSAYSDYLFSLRGPPALFS